MANIEKFKNQSSLALFNPSKQLSTQEDLDKLNIKDVQALEVLSARLHNTLSNELDKDLKKVIAMECYKAVERLGQNNLDEQRANLIQEDVMRHLRAKCFNWTTLELSIAFRMGALGELGETPRHLTSQTMIGWLRGYETQTRTAATKELKRATLIASRSEEVERQANPKEMPAEQKKEAIMTAFDSYKNGQVLAGSFIYRLCVDLKILNITKDTAWRYIQRAKDEIMIEAKEAMINPITKGAAKMKIEEVKRVELGKSNTVSEAIKNRAQLLSVKDYFAECVAIDMSPIDLMETN